MRSYYEHRRERLLLERRKAEKDYPQLWEDDDPQHRAFRKSMADWVNTNLVDDGAWDSDKPVQSTIDSFAEVLTDAYKGPVVFNGDLKNPIVKDGSVVDAAPLERMLGIMRRNWNRVQEAVRNNDERIKNSTFWKPHLVVHDHAYFVNLRYPNSRFGTKCGDTSIDDVKPDED